MRHFSLTFAFTLAIVLLLTLVRPTAGRYKRTRCARYGYKQSAKCGSNAHTVDESQIIAILTTLPASAIQGDYLCSCARDEAGDDAICYMVTPADGSWIAYVWRNAYSKEDYVMCTFYTELTDDIKVSCSC